MSLLALIPIIFWGVIIVWIVRLNLRPKREPKKLLGPCSVCDKHFTNEEGGYIEGIPYCSKKCYDRAEREELEQELIDKERLWTEFTDELGYEDDFPDFDIDDKRI